MSIIGNLKFGRRGFSLVELLLTVVFVSLGSQMIQGGFLRAADLFGRYSHTLKAMVWSAEQEGRARESLLRDELQSASGSLSLSGKDLSWEQSPGSPEGANLHSVRLSVSWSEGGRPASFQKEFYAYKRDASQTL